MDTQREKAFQDYRKKLMEHKEVESRLKDSKFFVTSFRFLPNHLKHFVVISVKPFDFLADI